MRKSGVVQNLRGHQDKSRRAELRAEASRPVGREGAGFLGTLSARRYGGAVSFPVGSEAMRPSDFVDFGTQEFVVDDCMTVVKSRLTDHLTSNKLRNPH